MDLLFRNRPHLSGPNKLRSLRSILFGNGIPQGSVLSPLLFTVMINDLPENISSNVNLYADDCCIWNTGLKSEETQMELQTSLDKITEWCYAWGFRINVKKSAVVVFTRRRKACPVNLTIANITLPVLKEFKYLGLSFDSRLTYRQHSRNIEGKVTKRINVRFF